jgi:hypothetical protein
MKNIPLSKEHYTLPSGNLGSIHLASNFFADVEKETEKAVYIQYFGKMHWLPKSAFIGKDLGEGTHITCIVFTIKPFFMNQIMSKF